VLFWSPICTVWEIRLIQGVNDVQMLRFKLDGKLDILRSPSM